MNVRKRFIISVSILIVLIATTVFPAVAGTATIDCWLPKSNNWITAASGFKETGDTYARTDIDEVGGSYTTVRCYLKDSSGAQISDSYDIKEGYGSYMYMYAGQEAGIDEYLGLRMRLVAWNPLGSVLCQGEFDYR